MPSLSSLIYVSRRGQLRIEGQSVRKDTELYRPTGLADSQNVLAAASGCVSQS